MDNDQYYYNESGDFIVEPPKDCNDPFVLSCKIKWHFCTKCFANFTRRPNLELHIEHCNPQFKSIIYQDGDLSIVKVTSESSAEEKRICEQLMTIQADEIGALYDSLAPSKWTTHKYQVFLLFDKNSIVSAAVIQRGNIPNEEGLSEECILMSQIFTLYTYRRKGLTEKLLSVALEKLDSNFKTAVFQMQFTKNGEACLTRIAKKQALKSIRTFCPPFGDRIMPFPII